MVKTRVQFIQKFTGNCSLRTRSFLLKSLGWFCPTLEWLPPHVGHDPKMDARVPLHQHLYGGYHRIAPISLRNRCTPSQGELDNFRYKLLASQRQDQKSWRL